MFSLLLPSVLGSCWRGGGGLWYPGPISDISLLCPGPGVSQHPCSPCPSNFAFSLSFLLLPGGRRPQLNVSLRSGNRRSLLSLSPGQKIFTAEPPTEQSSGFPPGPQGGHCSVPLASVLKLVIPTRGGLDKQQEPRVYASAETGDLLGAGATKRPLCDLLRPVHGLSHRCLIKTHGRILRVTHPLVLGAPALPNWQANSQLTFKSRFQFYLISSHSLVWCPSLIPGSSPR